jgi:hypothetical protein
MPTDRSSILAGTAMAALDQALGAAGRGRARDQLEAASDTANALLAQQA